MLPQSLWVHVFISPVMPGRHSLLGVLHQLWLLQTSAEFPKPWRELFDKGIPFRAVHSKLCHSAHCLVRSLCISSYLCRRKLFCWWLRQKLFYGRILSYSNTFTFFPQAFPFFELRTSFGSDHCLFLLCFGPGYSGTCFIDQADLELTEIYLPLLRKCWG